MPYPQTYPAEAADAEVTDLTGLRCPRLSSPGEVARRLAELDTQYLISQYEPLDKVAAGRQGGVELVRAQIAGGLLPQPAYRLDDGTDLVPADYFDLVDAAGGVGALDDWFRARYAAAAERLGLPHDDETVDDQWEGYLSGGYFVCLTEATPEAIAQKALYITILEELLARPAPEDGQWATRLRETAEALAAIERPGSLLDQARWGGPMSQQWYGSYLKGYFPQAFTAGFVRRSG